MILYIKLNKVILTIDEIMISSGNANYSKFSDGRALIFYC